MWKIKANLYFERRSFVAKKNDKFLTSNVQSHERGTIERERFRFNLFLKQNLTKILFRSKFWTKMNNYLLPQNRIELGTSRRRRRRWSERNEKTIVHYYSSKTKVQKDWKWHNNLAYKSIFKSFFDDFLSNVCCAFSQRAQRQ